MNIFIERNKRLLMFYYRAARIGGWLFVSLAILTFFGKSVALATRLGDRNEFQNFWQHDVPWGMFSDVLPTGILILGVAQLIWYLLETDHKASWILRQSHRLFYLYTAILLVYYIVMCVVELRTTAAWDTSGEHILRMIMMVMFIAVKLLALVGVAEFLRRLLPVIEEQKSLV